MIPQLRILALATLVASSSALAHADTIGGTASFADYSNNNNLIVNAVFASPTFTQNVSPNGPASTYMDFLTLFDYINNNGQTATRTDNISVTFDITNPATASGTLGGSTTEHQTSHGRYDTYTGDVTWDNPLSIALSSGENLTINLADTTLRPGDACGGYDICGNVDATFALTSSPSAVPEPGSFALLGTGLLGILGATRRKLFS